MKICLSSATLVQLFWLMQCFLVVVVVIGFLLFLSVCLSVRCIQNCGSYLMQSSNLVLQASCLNCLTSEGDDISYSWKIYRQEENAAGKRVRNFDWEENSSTGRNQEYLVIKGQALVELEAGMYYLEASGRIGEE